VRASEVIASDETSARTSTATRSYPSRRTSLVGSLGPVLLKKSFARADYATIDREGLPFESTLRRQVVF
jgi:hypothetical protein